MSSTDFMRNTRQSTANLILRASSNLSLPCKTKNPPKPSSTSGAFSTSTTRVPSILSSLTCFSAQSFKSYKPWKSAASTSRISRMKFLIWQNLSYPWPLPLMIWSSADREILLSLCSLMLRPSLTMIRGRMGRRLKDLMTFDSKKVH